MKNSEDQSLNPDSKIMELYFSNVILIFDAIVKYLTSLHKNIWLSYKTINFVMPLHVYWLKENVKKK